MRSKRAFRLICGVILAYAAVAANAGTGDPEYRSADSRQSTILEDPCPASDFPPIEIAFASVINQDLPGTTTGIRCIAEVRRKGEPVRGVPILLGGELIDGDGNPVASLPARSGSTNRAGQKTFTFPYSVPPPGSQLAVIMGGVLNGDQEVDAVDTTCGIIQREPCTNSPTHACLSGRRFKVEVSSQLGQGRLLTSNKTEATFAFGQGGSSDLVVELLQRCTRNDHYWVFYSATTSVDFDLTVTDTFNGESRAYGRPRPLLPILDTAAFATCP